MLFFKHFHLGICRLLNIIHLNNIVDNNIVLNADGFRRALLNDGAHLIAIMDNFVRQIDRQKCSDRHGLPIIIWNIANRDAYV